MSSSFTLIVISSFERGYEGISVTDEEIHFIIYSTDYEIIKGFRKYIQWTYYYFIRTDGQLGDFFFCGMCDCFGHFKRACFAVIIEYPQEMSLKFHSRDVSSLFIPKML